MALPASPVQADEVYPGIRYACADGYFTIHPAYTENPSTPPAPAPGFFPHVQDPAQTFPRPVALCRIDDAELVLSLTFQNVPRPAGLCGGALWGTYLIERDGQTVLTFGIGCFEDAYVVANKSGLSVCFALGHECQAALWDDIKASPIEE